jgi:hypothetical protein
MKVVAKLPPIDEKVVGQHFGLEQSSNLGHDYGLGQSPKENTIAIAKACALNSAA